jgi:hypothetical protein
VDTYLIECPRRRHKARWPADRAMPIRVDCAILRHLTVYMQRMLEESTINAPKEPDPDGLPEGLRPFERQVIRGNAACSREGGEA